MSSLITVIMYYTTALVFPDKLLLLITKQLYTDQMVPEFFKHSPVLKIVIGSCFARKR